MSLRISNIELHRFRNYDTFSLGDIGPLTIIVGQNGIGKTNILEAINLLTAGESFRNAQIAQLVKEQEETSRILLDMSDGNRVLQTALLMEAGKKKFTVNGKAKAVADMKGVLPAVSFTPDDLQLAKKTSSAKRAALDALGSQLSKSYYIVRRDYEKALRFKNRLLKDEAGEDMLDSIDETLLVCAVQLFSYRMALFNRMLPVLIENYRDISLSSEDLGATYTPSWEYLANKNGNVATESVTIGENGAPDKGQVRDVLKNYMQTFRLEERARKRSLVGPHNDKVEITLAQKDAASFASQGQQRSIVLAWKLAEVEMIRHSLGVNPVLLLDDVMSELDAARRDKLVSFVTDDIQTFITATDLAGFNDKLLEKAQVIQL